MKLRFKYLRNIVFLLLTVTLFSSMLMAQKRPKSVSLDVDADDMKTCASQGIFETTSKKNTSQQQQQQQQQQNITNNDDKRDSFSTSQLCVLYRSYFYNLNSGNLEGAMYNRNDMIDLVVRQVNAYFKHRKDGRKSKIRIFETILDFLRIGGDLSIAIMNGERAKSIIGASLGGLDTGRTKFDKNFEILSTQVLINNMIAKRFRVLSEMTVAKDKPVRAARASNAYTWEQARDDLQRYLLAGTFDDALDTLVKKSGEDVAEAEAVLKAVSKKDVLDARCANSTLAELDTALKNDLTKDEATTKLREIVTKLLSNPEIGPRLTTKTISATSEGRAIWNALFLLRGDLVIEGGKDELIIKIDQAIGECRL